MEHSTERRTRGRPPGRKYPVRFHFQTTPEMAEALRAHKDIAQTVRNALKAYLAKTTKKA